jgi:hypothetical protein
LTGKHAQHSRLACLFHVKCFFARSTEGLLCCSRAACAILRVCFIHRFYDSTIGSLTGLPLVRSYYPLKSIHPAMMRYPGPILHSCSWIIGGSQPAAKLIKNSQSAASSHLSAEEESDSSNSRSRSRGRLEASNVGFEMHGTTIEVGEGASLDARVCDVRSIGGTVGTRIRTPALCYA